MDGRLRVLCGMGAALLLILTGCTLLFLTSQTTTTPALAATTCPISGLPPTPAAAPLADPNSIKLNEILSNPKQDWDCDGDAGANKAKNQWLELANLSGTDATLGQLEILSQNSNNNQPVLLNSTARISAQGYLAIFIDQISGTFSLFPGGGSLELLDGNTGAIVDSVSYPALGQDQSFARDTSGQWSVSTTPTPGTANAWGKTPTPTATHHAGGGGGGASTATPAPVGSVFIPTDTPNTLAFQGSGNGSASGGTGGGTSDTTIPGWLKITLLILMGAGLVAVVIWYIRNWGQEPESDA